MAKNKVEVDVIVDDKGTTKKLGLESKKASEGLDKTAKSARTADRNLKGASQQSANGTKNFSKMAQGMSGGLVPAYATFAASVFALTAVFQGLKEAADFRVVKDAQVAFSSATGVGMMTLTANIKSATDGLVGFKEASQAAAIGTASGLGVEQIENLAKGAREVSLILGRDVTDSFNRLIRGVTKAEPELLDELGITLRLKDATENYAASINKAASELTLYERSQAVAAEVQDQLDKKYASVAASVELQSNSIAQLGIAFEKVIQPIQRFGAAIMEPVADFLSKNITALAGVFALFAIPIVKAAIPALEGWSQKSEEASLRASKAYEEAREEIERLTVAQQQLKLQGGDAGTAAQAALQGQKGLTGGAAKIQQGDFTSITKRELSGLLSQAEKGKGLIMKLPKEMRAQYLAALREMKNGTKTSMADIEAKMRNMTDRAKLQFKKMKAGWAATMSSMKKLAAGASKFINKAMKLAGLVGIIVMIKDLVVGVSKSLGFGNQEKEVTKLAASFEQLADQMEMTAKEFEKFASIQEKYYEAQENALLPTIEGLGKVGNFLDSHKSKLEDFFDVMDKYNNLGDLGALDRVSMISALEEQIGLLGVQREVMKDLEESYYEQMQAAVKAGQRSFIPKLMSGDEFQGIDVVGRLQEIEREAQAVTEKLRELKETPDRILSDADTNFFEKHILGHDNLHDLAKEAKENAKIFGKDLATGLRAARIETQHGGAEFLTLVDRLAETGTLAEEDRARFAHLQDQLIGLGAEARLAAQEFGELNKQFTTKITGMTNFTTSVTSMLAQANNQISLYDPEIERTVMDSEGNQVKKKGGILSDTADAPVKLKEAKDMRGVLLKLHEQEVGLALRTLGIQTSVNALMVGATDLAKEEITRGQQLAEIESQKIGILNNLLILKDSDVAADRAKAQQLALQLELLYQQEGQLQRNADIALSILDDMTNAFQNSFSTGLADIIKGKESSFSDMIGNAAVKGLEAAADNLAKNMTKSLFGIKDESPEEKIKNGMMAAADYHKSKILEGIRGTGDTPSVLPKGTGEEGAITLADVPTSNPLKVSGVGEGITTNEDGASVKVDGDAFTAKLDNIMGSEAPFLDKLGGVFDLSITNLGSGLKSGFGEIFAGLKGIGGGLLDIFGFASGGIASPGKKFDGYSSGGIARGSKQGYPAVLHGTEAVVPLPNGKSIPVEMSGAGAQQNNVVVNVSTDGSINTQSSDNVDSEALGKAVAAAVKEELQNQKRSGGILNPYGVA